MANAPSIDTTVLPDEPLTWSSAEEVGFRQQWTPGAFGERTDLADVYGYIVEEDTWSTDDAGVITRTITKGRVTTVIRDGVEIPVGS